MTWEKTGGGVLRQGGGGEAEGEGLGIKRMRRRCWAEKIRRMKQG